MQFRISRPCYTNLENASGEALNSIIEFFFPFPYFYWIVVAYRENFVFLWAHKKLSIALVQCYPKKMQTCQGLKSLRSKDYIFGNICNCFIRPGLHGNFKSNKVQFTHYTLSGWLAVLPLFVSNGVLPSNDVDEKLK